MSEFGSSSSHENSFNLLVRHSQESLQALLPSLILNKRLTLTFEAGDQMIYSLLYEQQLNQYIPTLSVTVFSPRGEGVTYEDVGASGMVTTTYNVFVDYEGNTRLHDQQENRDFLSAQDQYFLALKRIKQKLKTLKGQKDTDTTQEELYNDD